MNKLIGGFDTKFSSCRIYDLNGECVLANSQKAPCEIMETLAIYMNTPWEQYRNFKFFHHRDYVHCECVIRQNAFEAFVCGYGTTEQESFENCCEHLDNLTKKYINDIEG